MNFGRVCEPFWDDAFLIGGGPSLKSFDFNLLKGRTTLAVNDSALRLPWSTALFSLDRTWITERREFIKSFTGEKFIAAPDDVPRDIPGVVYLQRSREGGLSSDPGTIRLGGTSGYGALNVAYLKKAKRIFLLGYDYRYTQAGCHWFSEYEWAPKPNNTRYFDAWALNFLTAQHVLDCSGVEVVNVGETSKLAGFTRVRLADFASWLKRGYDGVELLRKSCEQH